MTDLRSHQCTCLPDSVLTHVSLMDRQCQVPWHQPDLWKLTTCSLYSFTCILGWTPVPVIWPHYIYRSHYVHPGTYATWSLNPMVQPAPWLEDHIGWTKTTAIPAWVYNTCHRRPCSTWLARHIDCSPMTALTLFLPWHTPAASQHGQYHRAYTRTHLPTGSYDGGEEL